MGSPSEMIFLILSVSTAMASAVETWSKGHDHHHHSNHVDGPTATLDSLEVVCSRDHMTVHMHFDQPFHGVVFSHGAPKHERCVHVGPRAGVTSVSFDIMYDSCGTVEDRGGQFHENTLVVQFDEDILEAWDQAKRLRCEWLENFEKKSSKPTLAISDLDVVELNFQGDDIDCWMEVQEGKGPWARQVGGLVPLGSPLTLVVAIDDRSREFDLRIKRCSAGDGKGSEIELTDDRGCVLRPSLLAPFAKVRDFGGRATLVAYSRISAFKFPGGMDVFVHCVVEVCRHGCPDSCIHQKSSGDHPAGLSGLESIKIAQLKALAASDHPVGLSGLESKKVEKLQAFADFNNNHHQQHQKDPAPDIPLPGRERNREEVLVPHHTSSNHPAGLSESKKVEHLSAFASSNHHHQTDPEIDHSLPGRQRNREEVSVAGKNSSTDISVIRKMVAEGIRATFSPAVFKAALEEKKRGEQKKIEGASSNAHGIFVDIENALRPNPLHQEAPTAHEIVGHDVHWISGGAQGVAHSAAKLPSPKVVSYHAPQPVTWSADEVKTMKEPLVSHQAPQPEPASWSADQVRPLSKTEVYHSNKPYVSKIRWSDDGSVSDEDSRTKQRAPQPEPAPWTFEEVNPMHSPGIAAKLHQQQRPPEPQPEPWSLDDVKGLSRENLRILSLNHKMKSPAPLPVYGEVVRPVFGSTTALPQPVYVSRHPFNTSSRGMMMMKMMMPTMLPPTYQTAHWPLRHHYPYPVPQFSPLQQMAMMGVVADRRMDAEEGDDISLYHNLGEADTKMEDRNEDVSTEKRTADRETTIGIGQVYREGAATSESAPEKDLTDAFASVASGRSAVTVVIHKRIPPTAVVESKHTLKSNASEQPEELGKESNVQVPNSSGLSAKPDKESGATIDSSEQPVKLGNELGTRPPSSDQPTKLQKGSLQAVSLQPIEGARPAISGFVPPSLDADSGSDPDSKEKAAVPVPRALDRRKRSSEPVFAVRQSFRAIAPSDMAFDWTAEGPALLRGRPQKEEVIYGICVSPAGMTAGVGFVLVLTLLSIIASVVFYEHSCQLTHKTSQLSFFTRTFNGQFEALYKITRPYLYSGSTR